MTPRCERGGRVALARLDYADTVKVLTGINSTDARGLRDDQVVRGQRLTKLRTSSRSMLQDPRVPTVGPKQLRVSRAGARDANPFR
jgi:hypothetical protein